MSQEIQDRRQKAAKAEARAARLAEEMKANMRKRKGQKKARVDGAADEDASGGVHEDGGNERE